MDRNGYYDYIFFYVHNADFMMIWALPVALLV